MRFRTLKATHILCRAIAVTSELLCHSQSCVLAAAFSYVFRALAALVKSIYDLNLEQGYIYIYIKHEFRGSETITVHGNSTE